ncbi:MAG: TIGR00282 family metallophosphoesterase [bacterium]
MKWLCLGDIVSSPGRSAVRDFLEDERDKYDFIMANGENAAGGAGLTVDTAKKLLDYGVDVITGGNHIWQKNDFVDFLTDKPDNLPVLRPANYPGSPPGRGYKIFRVRGLQILVLNLEGRTYMEDIDCPFRKADSIIQSSDFDLALVDFHAEATSEKIALANHLAGRVTAVVGTHTHVQTADEKLLPGRTAYITDLGMTGPRDSVIGVRSELAEKRFLTARPVRFKVEKKGPRIVNGLNITVDEDERQVVQLERVNKTLPQRTY